MARALNGDIRRRVDHDGRVWFSGEDAAELLLRGYDIAALHIEITPEIDFYNQWCQQKDKAAFAVSVPLELGDVHKRLDTWWIAAEFRAIDVRTVLAARCHSDAEHMRVAQEMDLFEARELVPVLHLMFMLVDHFRRNNIVWGVGRGSSVASFVLYLIGVHKINSLAYGLEITEFLHD